MAGRQAVTREMILDAAYRRAQVSGVASLGIRTLASDCGVAVGTIYNYFPDKASLVTEVVGRFWGMALSRAVAEAEAAGCPVAAKEGVPALCEPGYLLVYVRSLARGLAASLADYRAGWLREVSSLDARTRTRSHEAEAALFGEIIEGIERAIELDAGITAEARVRLNAPGLARFIWRAIFASIKEGDARCAELLGLLELGLYQR